MKISYQWQWYFSTQSKYISRINSSVHSNVCFKPISQEDNLKDKRVSRWQSLYCPISEPQSRMEHPVVTPWRFKLCLTTQLLFKGTHQNAMLGENRGTRRCGVPQKKRCSWATDDTNSNINSLGVERPPRGVLYRGRVYVAYRENKMQII